MKAFPALLMAILLVFCVSACTTPATSGAAGTQQASASPAASAAAATAAATQPPKALTDEDYEEMGAVLMESEAVGTLKLSMPSGDLIAALGQPESESSLEMWGADGCYHTTWEYKAKGLSIGLAGVESDKLTVYSIDAQAPCELTTLKGVKVGSAKDAVLTAYGYAVKDQTDEGTKDSIIAGGMYARLWFGMKDGLVESISIGPGAE